MNIVDTFHQYQVETHYDPLLLLNLKTRFDLTIVGHNESQLDIDEAYQQYKKQNQLAVLHK